MLYYTCDISFHQTGKNQTLLIGVAGELLASAASAAAAAAAESAVATHAVRAMDETTEAPTPAAMATTASTTSVAADQLVAAAEALCEADKAASASNAGVSNAIRMANDTLLEMHAAAFQLQVHPVSTSFSKLNARAIPLPR